MQENKKPFRKANAFLSDIDYWDKLSPEEKEYLQDFLRMYYHADPKSKLFQSLSVEEKRDCYNRDARNRLNRNAMRHCILMPQEDFEKKF